jgi:hypothetical protein
MATNAKIHFRKEKPMKKLTKLFFAILLIATMCLTNVTAFASEGQTDENEGIMPCLEHALNHFCSFEATSGGGEVIVTYRGDSTFSRADVTVKIEKRNLLVFWKDIYEFSVTSTDVNGSIYRLCPLDGSGNYRATITLTIYGTNGSSDSVTETIKSDY